MSDLEYKNELFTEGNIKLRNTKFDTLFDNQKKLPLILLDKEKKYSLQNLNTLSPTSKDVNLINFYKSIHCNNKPLDFFPNNFDKKRFIILNIETKLNTISEYLNNDKKDKLVTISAMEMVNMELTGIQFHAFFNDENGDNIKENNSHNNDNNTFFDYLSKYYRRRKDNDKKILEQLLFFIGKSMIICHNALYVIRFINKELKKNDLSEIPLNKCICTLRLARYKNYVNEKEQLTGFKIYDLCKNYSINIDKNIFKSCIMKTLALSLCVIKIIQEEKITKQNENEKINKNIGNNQINKINEKYYETEEKENFEKLEDNEGQSDSEPILIENKIIKLRNSNNINKNTIINSPTNNNTIYNIIQNDNKEFNKKYKIAKSFNKYRFICDRTNNKNNIFTMINNHKNKKDTFLMNNFTHKNALIKKNIFSEMFLFDNNKIKIDDTN